MRRFSAAHHINSKDCYFVKSLLTISATALIVIIGILVILSLKMNCASSPLSDSQMQAIHGGDCCGGCKYAAFRKDECFHTEDYPQPCATDACIANYIFDADCPLNGGSSCSATINTKQVSLIQYYRASIGCAASYQGELRVLYVHHFGHDCTPRAFRFRCDTSGCDGTLIESSTRYGLIIC